MWSQKIFLIKRKIKASFHEIQCNQDYIMNHDDISLRFFEV